jgi:hypothetical protein
MHSVTRDGEWRQAGVPNLHNFFTVARMNHAVDRPVVFRYSNGVVSHAVHGTCRKVIMHILSIPRRRSRRPMIREVIEGFLR